MEFSHGFLLPDSHEMMQAEVSGSDDFLDAQWFKINGTRLERVLYATINRYMHIKYGYRFVFCASPPLSNFSNSAIFFTFAIRRFNSS